MTGYRLTTEVFRLPYLGRHIVYAPLLETSLLVDDGVINLLGDIGRGGEVIGDHRNGEALALLLDLGLVADADDGTPEAPSEERPSATIAFAPTDCTLFPTTACNLRCLYCYARGGDRPRFLADEIATAAIDLVVGNAVAAEAPQVALSFHGGGEPTMAGDRLTRWVDYARRACAAHGIDLVTAIATNGLMGDAMREFLVRDMNSVMVSVDGPPAVQNRLRPRLDGGPSFDAVDETLSRLDDGACSVGARLTCTSESVEQAVSTVRYLVEHHRLDVVHLEPLFVCGRSLDGGVRPPQPERFIEIFRLCHALAACHDVDMLYSGARQVALATSFCQACGPSFNVTTDGDVTACFEVTDRDDPRERTFIFGVYEETTGGFVFDEQRIAGLRRLTVREAERCQRCFSKYHCAGDCPSKRLYPGADDAVLARCGINRRLTQDRIEDELIGSSDAVAVAAHVAGEQRHNLVFAEENGSTEVEDGR